MSEQEENLSELIKMWDDADDAASKILEIFDREKVSNSRANAVALVLIAANSMIQNVDLDEERFVEAVCRVAYRMRKNTLAKHAAAQASAS